MRLEPFVPEIVRRLDRDKPWAEWIDGTVLFADVSGFTPLSEALAALGAEGAEILTDILNRYFAEMIGILHAHGGQVMKFGGDAILCFLEGSNTLEAAERAAMRMQAAMPRFAKVRTPVRTVSLQMKIGIARGECLIAGLGDKDVRCEYAFAGAPVDLSAEAEHRASAGDVIVAGAPAFPPQQEIAPGFFRILGGPSQDSVFEAGTAGESHSDAAAIRPYLIPEIYDLVSAGYQRYAGSLSSGVSVFLKMDGFQYGRESLDLARLNGFLKKAFEITREYGGRLNRLSMGDKGTTLLLLFGTPAPLEKKEQMACQWALDLRKIALELYPEVGLRIGMTSGRVFSGIVGGSGRFEFTVMGDCVNLAARLMQGAAAGETSVDSEMRDRATETFEFSSLGKRKFKGKSESLEVFALADRKGIASLQNSELFGRSQETSAVMQWLQQARSGNPCMIVLEGEPGVGKSSLAAQVLAQTSGWKVVTTRGDITRRGFAYNPWRDPFVTIVFEGRMPDEGQLSERLDQSGFADFISWHAAFLGFHAGTEPARLDEESKRNLLHHQLSVLLVREIQSPVLLVLDDLHWFKSMDLDLLNALLNHMKDQPLAVLATARPDWPRESFVNRSTCHFVALRALDRSATREIAEKLLGAPVRENVLDYLEKQARGNPFFLRQLLDYLIRNQLVTLQLGEWTLSREGSLDRSLSGDEIVVTQIEQLSLPERMHLRAAACIGPTLSPAVLRQTLGHNFRSRVLQSLRSRGYLQDAAESRLAFPHALFQEAIYHSLPKRLRRQYHRRIGYALETLHAAEIAKYLPTLAHHFYESGVRSKAIDYCIAAGNEYHARKSAPEALQLLERAWQLLCNTSDTRKWDVALRLADNMTRAGRAEDCLMLTRRVISAASKSSNIGVFFKCSAIQFDTLSRAADYSYLKRAETLLRHPALEANISPNRIRFYIGLAHYRMAQFDQAAKDFQQIIDSESHPTPTVLNSHMFLASIAKLRGHYDIALNLLADAAASQLAQSDSYRQLSISIEKANVLIENEKYEAAEHLLMMLLDQAGNLGDYYLLGVALLNLAGLKMDQENFEQAELFLNESNRIFSTLGAKSMLGKVVMEMGALSFYRANYDAALESYMRALEIFENSKQMDQGRIVYYNIAEALAKINRRSEALEWVQRGIEAVDSTQNPKIAKAYSELQRQLLSENQ